MSCKAPCAVLFLLAVLASGVTPLPAQLQVSEKYSLMQVIDGVEITIMGSRPTMRGRTIYGDVVPWNETWPAGARTATTLEVGREFSVNNKIVPAGRYSLWLRPRKGQPWLMMLDPRDSLGHGAHPDSLPTQYHFHVNATDVAPVETLTWSINNIRGFGSVVRMEWADKRVEFNLKLTTDMVLAADSAASAATSGEYSIIPSPGDTTRAGEPQEPMAKRMTVTSEDGVLRLRFHDGWAEAWSAKEFWALIPRGADLFTVAELYDGEVVQMMPWAIEFSRDANRIASYEARSDPSDELMWSGKKRN